MMTTGTDARSGLVAAGLWTLVEFAFRAFLIVVVGGIVLAPRFLRGSAVEDRFLGAAVVGTLALTLSTLFLIFRGRVARERLRPDDLGYRFDRHRVLAGFASGLFLLFLLWGTSHVDLALFPEGAKSFEALLRLLAEAGPVVAAGMLLANGILAPLVEEFAWRGYIQYRLMRAWGTWAGLAGTALLFALKHMIVDASVGRITTLLVGACALGLIRQRWGTAASTAAHLTANFVATFYLLTTALRN